MDILFIILFLVMLGVLVTIHELGHYLAAKAFGVYVFEFAVGFGPKIFRKRKGETYYSLRALPLGGYVAMLGEEESIPDEFSEELKEISPKRSLNHINRGKKAIIMAAGITMNLILGYAIFLFANGALMQTKLTTGLTVSENSKASDAGILTGDAVLYEYVEVDGSEIQTFGIANVVGDAVNDYYVVFSLQSFDELDFGGQNIILVKTTISDITDMSALYTFKENDVINMTIKVERLVGEEKEVIEIPLTLETVHVKDTTYTLEPLGAVLTKIKFRYTFKQTFQQTNADFANASTAVIRGIKSLFTQGLTNVSGPVAIFSYSTRTLKNFGFAEFLNLWGMISINLALFNLLPFPPLDGWHLLVTAIEAITRQEIHPKFKQIASAIGGILLIVLSVIILAKDIFF